MPIAKKSLRKTNVTKQLNQIKPKFSASKSTKSKQSANETSQKEPAEKLTHGSFEITIGQKVDVLDYQNIWRGAEIRQLCYIDQTVLVHFDGTDDGTSAWYDPNSGRFRAKKNVDTNAFKIPKREQHLALSNSLSMEQLKHSSGQKMIAKERKVPQYKKGTYAVVTWVDGKIYPVVITRIISEVTYVVEFGDGARWALNSSAFIRTISKTEFERRKLLL